jgi:hypothetical protein
VSIEYDGCVEAILTQLAQERGGEEVWAVKRNWTLGGNARTSIPYPHRADYARGAFGEGLGDDVSAVGVPLVSMIGTVVSTADEVSRFAGRHTSTRAKRIPRMRQ